MRTLWKHGVCLCGMCMCVCGVCVCMCVCVCVCAPPAQFSGTIKSTTNMRFAVKKKLEDSRLPTITINLTKVIKRISSHPKLTVQRLGYRLEDPGFESQQGKGISLCSKTFSPTLGNIEPPILWVIGTLSPEVNRPGRETDHVQLLPKLVIYGAKSTFAPVCIHGVERDFFLQFRV